ncbi:MAG: 3-ketoacyl-ACP reductase [Propionibacteriaceae bacterium]|jgi:NAD(P)-dependent dehydrogenase (short-subunit alcohol dehydrogenase family)|nr:3-ketoacyl-ACP reductase [Propionibacteriaceae bacterium]
MPPVALVTGGSRGIGLGVSRRLLQDGFAVAILARRPSPAAVAELRAEAGEDRVLYLQGSVADLADQRRYLDAALERWGRLDLLVNNAGVAPAVRADLLEATPESFDRVLGVNLRGPHFLTQAFARAVLGHRLDPPPPDSRAAWSESAGGAGADPPDRPLATIVNISSISATAVSTDRGDYCLSKAGLAMATQLWAVRLAPVGIVVYEVRPGIIATDMTAAARAKYDQFLADGHLPIARWGRPADVAAAVSLLAAGGTPYSTGEVFHVDGGLHTPVL